MIIMRVGSISPDYPKGTLDFSWVAVCNSHYALERV